MKTSVICFFVSFFVIGWATSQKCGLKPAPTAEVIENIIGGERAPRDSWPWMAAIFFQPFDMLQCGATIIGDQWLLTAGHCFNKYIPDTDWQVRVGAYEENDPVENYDVLRVFIHDKFDNRNFTYNDVALVKVNATILGPARPLCLTNYSTVDENANLTQCFITGWGAEVVKGEHHEQSKHLKQARVPLVEVYKCAKSYRDFQVDPNTQICAGGEGAGTCFGDSGSALQCWDPDLERWTLLGVTSYGKPCARQGIPDVFSSIPAFHDWILKTMNEN